MAKSSTKTKTSPKASKEACQFIRDHVEKKMVAAGWDKEKACDMVSCVSDTEISECCAECGCEPEKMQAFGDGKILKWLQDNGPALLETAQKIFSLLALFGGTKSKTESADGEESEDEEEETEDEE